MQQATSNRGGSDQEPKGFKSLLAWQAAMDLSSLVYRALKKLPPSENWLKSQVNGAAMSVPANIAEGYGRGTIGDNIRFLEIATGSLCELENYIYFLTSEGLLRSDDAQILDEARVKTGRLLHGLLEGTRRKSKATWNRGSRIGDEPQSL